MHEDILAGGALDESVSLRPVEPLHSTLLSHKETPFVSSLRIVLPPLLCLPRDTNPDNRQPPRRAVRTFLTGVTVGGAMLHQQKQLPCIPADGCPRRNTVEPRRRRRNIALLDTETSIFTASPAGSGQ